MKTQAARVLAVLFASLWMTIAGAGPMPVFETPDFVEMKRGAHAVKKGYYGDAVRNFQRAAEYGNKAAQKVVGMMYLQGTGVERDWATGYVWLKLAATHGNPEYIQARDEVFAQLKSREKKQTQRIHSKLEKKYGDAAALARREEWVRKQKRQITGSRTGQSAAVRVQVADATGYTWQVSGAQYFDLLYGSYVAEFRQNMGEVEIGEFKVVDAANGDDS